SAKRSAFWNGARSSARNPCACATGNRASRLVGGENVGSRPIASSLGQESRSWADAIASLGLFSSVAGPYARQFTDIVVHRGADGLRRRLLVLVFHASRCCRRGQFTVPFCACRLVHRLACLERDLWPGVGEHTGDG